jgi:hypothetical protein
MDEIASAIQTNHAEDPFREQGKSNLEEHVASHRSDSFRELNMPLHRDRGGRRLKMLDDSARVSKAGSGHGAADRAAP